MISLLRSPVTRPVLARRIGTPPKPLRVASTLSQPRKLDLPALDRKWQAIWQQQEGAPQKSPNPVHQYQYQQQQPTASTPPQTTDTPRTYILSMFPYPSGTLHMGHLRVYTISDVLARFYRLRGHDVLHPMGWDAFGLPAENAAMERGVDPAVWTRGNIERMKAQLGRFSGCFDWDCELTTCEPEFYEHTQRIFLLLYRHGLAYRDEAVVNYDPVDGTVLANEQVDARGYSWRSGGRIQKLKLRQWFFRITAFKETLLNDLDSLTGGWPERVLSMQRNWLGRSEGAKVKFPVSVAGGAQHDAVSVFTTRPDTLYGVEYLALSLNHPIVRQAAEKDEQLRVFVEDAASLPGDSKVGYKLSDVWASHPLHIIDKESPHVARNLPVFAAPYVVGDYGEGAVMGVPGHDARDLVFFKQNANPDSIPMVVGAEPLEEGTDSGVVSAADAKAFTNEGYLTSRCWKYQGLHSREASKQIVTDLKMVAHGEAVEQWRLRDWLISRQRYWGTPIPIIHCDDCGAVPVPEDQLPVKLPPLNEEILKGRQGKKGNPLEWSEEWKRVECPSCGKPATRDTDTMDTFVDSSWYYLRFLDAKNKEQPFASGSARPVDVYIGGVEHAILHLLYARFIYKFLSQSELFPEIARMDPSQSQSQSPRPPAEPFKTLISQGMVHGKTYTDPTTGRIIPPEEIDASKPDQPVIKDTQTRPQVSFEKMSKSKHNGVDPTACTQRYGADAARAHVLFAAPVSEVLEWDESKIVGIERWYGRVWKVVHDVREQIASRGGTAAGGGGGGGGEMALPAVQELSDDEAEAVLATQQTIESVTHSIEANVYGLNTVVSDLTKLTNTLAGASGLTVPVAYVCARALLGMLAPIAPALASEGWEVLHGAAGAAGAASVPGMGWPRPLLSPDDAQTLRARGGQTVAVQVNGKLRFTVQIPRAASATTAGSTEASDSWVVNRVLETRAGVEWLRERNDWEKRKRVVVVKGGRVVNVVF